MMNKDKVLSFITSENYKPMTEFELADKLKIEQCRMTEFHNLVEELVNDMSIIRTKKNRLISSLENGLFVGTLEMNSKGYGFIRSDVSNIKDLYVSSNNLNGSIHGDRVVAKVLERNTNKNKIPFFDGYRPSYYFRNPEERMEGRIENILNHKYNSVVGTFEDHGSFGFVVPDNKKIMKDIFIPKNRFNGAENDDKVECDIVKWSLMDKSPEGVIKNVIGRKGGRFVSIMSVLKEYELPDIFPKNVLAEAESLSHPDECEISKRLDLRDMFIFTIDGSDAKDLDDAISVNVLSNGNYELGVHIADVTHYVKENGRIDKEALKRATSVYLVDKVIPMLPEKLSNDLCSLHPHTDKLTLSIIMEIDKKGTVVNYDIKESVINSKRRFTYTEVSNILESDECENNEDDFIKSTLYAAKELCEILRIKRMKDGAIDLDLPETKVILDEMGKVISIEPYENRIANKIIEEFMIISNRVISEHFYWLGIPFVYRIHEVPDKSKMDELNNFLEQFDLKIDGDLNEVHPKQIQKLVRKLNSIGNIGVNNIILRSFKHARYFTDAIGHFGLSADYYSHFTSPIRRYPDLQIHRIIKEYLSKGYIDMKRQHALEGIVSYSSEQSSAMERKAEQAERDVKSIYMCEYAQKHLNESYEGIVSNIIPSGIFVKLPNTLEGMVKISELPYDINYNETYHSLQSDDINIKIGDKVNIIITSSDIDKKEITFSMK